MISWKIAFARLHDALMAGAAMLIAIGARFGFDALPALELVALWVGVTIAIAAITFRAFGLGRGMWRFASVTDLRVIVVACAATMLAFVVVIFLLNRLDTLPRTAPLIAWFVMVVLLGAPRLAYRALKDGGLALLRPSDLAANDVTNVLIIGGATQADRVIRTYGLENSTRYRVRGIIDHTRNRTGSDLRGIPILGGTSDLDGILTKLSSAGVTINAAIFAGPGQSGSDLRQLFTVIAKWNLPLRQVSDTPLTGGEPDLENVRLEDLLGRPPVQLEMADIHSLISNRVVAITGAGGSIGSEIVRQVAELTPSRIVLIENSEYALYQIDRELTSSHGNVPRYSVIADVRDRSRISELFIEERPAIVFHAAALKHVPIVEQNEREGVLTNIVGTRNVADAAVEAEVDAMVLISTDKTIRPTSVMGATKRAAEGYCQACDVSGTHTRFVTVRFGNVLGSAGSVVPLFKQQILAGGPVTVTHPDVRRYFMTIREATQLVLQAAASAMRTDSGRGDIFVLDMGEPLRIVDLARTMIVLSGLRPDDDIAIKFIGLRPGEKLFEELFDRDQQLLPSAADGVFLSSGPVVELDRIRSVVVELEGTAIAGDTVQIRKLLHAIIPEYCQDETAESENSIPTREQERSGTGSVTSEHRMSSAH